MKLSGTTEHLLLVLALVTVAGLFAHNNILWRWDNLIYDTQLSLRSRSVSDNIIIVAIDDQSLNDIGHWPWPRSKHADLIDKLEQESPRVIGLDIIFSEPDTRDPESDQLLSASIQKSGKVVLPVYMARQSRNAVPIEALPLPIFTRHAASLGHVYVDISSDGIARKLYLWEGIDRPHWMHFSLAVLSQAKPEFRLSSSAYSEQQPRKYSSMQWSREQPLLIPYAGPPGHFPSIGYSQVLSGHYAKDLFRDKIVLVGATAEGMGDALPTPMSGGQGSMPGVEIIANMIDALDNNLRITEIPTLTLTLLTVLLVAIPVLLYPYLNPAHTLILLFGMISATTILVALLLLWFSVWVPAASILLFQLLSYPLWSWRRLVLAMRYLNNELDQLLGRQEVLTLNRDRHLANDIEFLSAFIPLAGWVVFNEKGSRLLHQGKVPPRLSEPVPAGAWHVKGEQLWAAFDWQKQTCLICLNLQPGTDLSNENQRLLDNFIQSPRQPDTPKERYLEDVFRARISQVQSVANEYEALHRIIDDSLSGMADGVLICNSHGQIMLSNKRAGWYLQGNDNASLNGKSLLSTLRQVQLSDNASWTQILQQVVINKQRALSEAQHDSGRDLMVEISPLHIIGDQLSGFVLNLSDISILKSSERKRGEVLNFLSHDLRSPLSSMIAMIELARNKSRLGDVQSMLQKMEKNTYKTLHLAEQFLQLSRANTHERLEFHDVDFNSIVLNAIDQLWALSNQLHVPIIHDFQHEELWTHAEPDLLERAIVNLLSNALKHSPADSEVKVTVRLSESQISCCIIDQGPGITAEDQPHLFEMFRRTQSQGIERKQGIGLGLAFVDAVAKRHSGHVEVKSRPGSGARFCFNIPQLETTGE